MRNAAIIALLGALSTVIALSGQSKNRSLTGEDLVRAELLTDASDFSHPFLVGVRFSISAGWNLYWKNPGDAGLPISVTWELPEGFTAKPAELPTPEKIVHDGVIAYGYMGEVVLLYSIVPPAGYSIDTPAVLEANLDWLVCRESCLRGKETVRLTLDGHDNAAGTHALFEKFSARLPHLPGDVLGAGVPTITDRSVVTIPLTGAAARTVTDFFPEQIPDFVIDHHSITIADSVIRFHVTPYDEQATIKEIRGLLIAPGASYAVVLPLPGKH